MKKPSVILTLLLSFAISFSYIPGEAFASSDDEQFTPTETVETIEDEVIDEDSVVNDSATYDEGLFQEALNHLNEKDYSQDENPKLSLIDEAYHVVTNLISEDTSGKEAAHLLSDLLIELDIDASFISGKDENGDETAWVIVRIEEDGLYYVLYPKADIGVDRNNRSAYLAGADFIGSWTADEEYTTESFIKDHPLSETGYEADKEDLLEEPADAAEADTILIEEEEKNSEAAEEEKNSEVATDKTAPDVAEKDGRKEIFGASEYTYASGYCGNAATWKITTKDWSNYTLSIQGSGPVYDYSSYSSVPWNSYRSMITKIVIGKNITAIGDNAFGYLYNVTSVKFEGKKLAFIGKEAFYYCYSLAKISLPSGLSYIDDSAFIYCYGLSKITFPTTLTHINRYAFYADSNLSKVTISGSVKYLGDYSLYNCTDVYYRGTPNGWKSINGPNAIGPSTAVHFAKSIKGAKITTKKSLYVYAAKGIKPLPVVKLKVNGKTKVLKKGRDYKVTYKNNKKVGTATITVTGINDYYGKASKKFKIVKRSIAKAKVSGVKSRSYTGKARKLSLVVKVKIGKKYVKLKKGRDYTVKYKNNKKLSTKKVRAQVIIKGKGNYKGKILRKFKIVKGSPGIKFAKKKITRTATQGSFTVKPKKAVKAKLKYTYSSSKTAVATVNKKTGKVTPKKVGTTTITVRTKATKHFKGGKASYKLTVRALKFGELKYSFVNYSTYYIPEKTFRLFYNPTQAKTHFYRESDMGTDGVCFGMSTSSSMLKMKGSGIKPVNFVKGAKNPSKLSMYNRFKSGGNYLYDIIEAMHVSQASPACQKHLKANLNNLKGMAAQVRKGNPVIIGMYGYWSGTGHGVVGYRIKKMSKYKERLYIYDCNYPEAEKFITLSKNAKGKYTGWSYDWDYCSPANITYIAGPTYRSIWKNRKAANKLAQMYVSSDNFQILDKTNTVVAEMKDGTFRSNDDNIYLASLFGSNASNHLVCMPSGAYTVTNTAGDSKTFEVTSLDEDQSINVRTSSDRITLETDDSKGVNTAVIEPDKGEQFEVTLLDGTSGGSQPDEVTFTGEGTGREITLGKEDGDIITDNAKNVMIEVNGEEQ